jgi:hypothetical protein
VLDKKRGDYFRQSFDENGHPMNMPSTQSSEDFKFNLPFIAIGDGAEKLSSEIGCEVLQKTVPSAVAIGKIALSRLSEPLPPEPLYLRDADVTV